MVICQKANTNSMLHLPYRVAIDTPGKKNAQERQLPYALCICSFILYLPIRAEYVNIQRINRPLQAIRAYLELRLFPGIALEPITHTKELIENLPVEPPHRKIKCFHFVPSIIFV